MSDKRFGDLSDGEINRLKREVFRGLSNDEKKDGDGDDYPKTITEKVSYAEHVTISSLDYIG